MKIIKMIGLAILLSVGITALNMLSVSAAEIGDMQTREKDGMLMLYVPAGDFTMGSDYGKTRERPAHTVFLDAYWIDQHEVTNAQYEKCVQEKVCVKPHKKSSVTRSNYYRNEEYANYPVIWVDWKQAKTYCAWAGGDLPTEAQWEKAARGTDQRTYPWGEEIDKSKANYDGKDTSEVCAYPSGNSPYGACDMGGNVWEWVNDGYDENENYYADSPKANPQGSATGNDRILRGGSWDVDAKGVRLTYRNDNYPTDSSGNWGFRCAFSNP